MQNLKTSEGLVLPITQEMLQKAEQFAQQQTSTSKHKQVIHNILAVLTVYQYLVMMDVLADLDSSDSWNPLLRYATNVADLKVPGFGHLECRPIDLQTDQCSLPHDLPDNRFGLIGVQLHHLERRARLRGFTTHFEPGQTIAVEELQPFTQLLSYLSRYEVKPSLISLPQVLRGELSVGWQRVEALLGTQQWNLAMSFMGTSETAARRITVAKLLNLGIQLGPESVVLLISPAMEQGGELGIRVQVHPSRGERYLPQELALTLLAQSGKMLKKVLSGTTDNFIQLPYFKCDQDEDFGIEISLADVSITEFFTCQPELTINADFMG